jgi:hypothetical protein
MSADEVRVARSSEDAGLRLFAPERHRDGSVEYFCCELGDQSARARLRVYAYDASGLSALFEGMAYEWKGWAGEKVWHSPESEFDLRASSDGRGHVTLKVTLTLLTPAPAWRFECQIPLEAGQLDATAAEVRSFIKGAG